MRRPGTDIFRSAAIALAFLALAGVATAQDGIDTSGVVLGPEGEPLPGAAVRFGDLRAVTTDADGRFRLTLPAGRWEVRVTYPGSAPLSTRVQIGADGGELLLQLPSVLQISEAVTVSGIRADADVPITKTDLGRSEIEALSHGQDAPALLQYTPSVTWYSDSGVGSNYSYLTLRGIQQTRINMTFDGAPLNDPAENAVYFNNFHGFLDEIDSVQIQRGVGTSSVGSPSYGGSVNFASRQPAAELGADVRLDVGSFDTRRAAAALHSGRFGSGFSASLRAALSSTDGYRERSGSEHRNFFARGRWDGARESVRLAAFSGTERSQLAFLAVEPEILAQNRRFNPLDEAERDDFTQNFAQLHYARSIGTDSLLSASAYYNGAHGWFRLWGDPVSRTELLQYGIDQGFWGAMLSASRDDGNWALHGGVHYSDFAGDHTLDSGSVRFYENTGFKKTLNAFAKAEARLDRWLLFGDLQLRWAEFRYRGSLDLGAVDWTFLDPRIGARWFATPQLSLYASVGRAQREPTRLDLLAGEDDATVPHDLRAVRPESVVDVEAGLGFATSSLSLQANLYAMEFRDEIALTGELSDIGLPLRRNVDASYRRGLEVDLRWRISPRWSLLHSLNLSRNRIREWTQYYDVYDVDGAWIGSLPIVYRDVRPLLSPEAVANLGLEWSRGQTAIAITGRYVGITQLDNTGLDEFRLQDWATLDLRATVDLSRYWAEGRPSLDLFVANLLDGTSPYPSGYSYQYLLRNAAGADTLAGSSYFYPLATRHAVLQLRFGF